MIKPRVNRESGLTAAELIVTVFIISILAVALGTFQSSTFSNERTARTKVAAMEDARLTIRRFLEETRNASPSSIGSYPVEFAQTNSFTFYSDTDNDGLKERFRYFLQSGSLKKAVLKPSGSPATYSGSEKVLTMVRSIDSITQNIFSYYDTNEILLTIPVSVSSIRSVRISLPVIVSTGTGVATTTVIFETRATLRNLKDNY